MRPMLLTSLIFGFLLSNGWTKEFADEAACKNKIPSACVRMALRDTSGGKKERNRLLSRALIYKASKGSAPEEVEAGLVAGALLYGNSLTKALRETGSVLEAACNQAKSPLPCLGRFSTLNRPGNSAKEKEVSIRWLDAAILSAKSGCRANDGFSCYEQALFQAIKTQSTEQMANTMEKACQLKEPAACSTLGEDRLAKGSPEEGMKYLYQACDLNYSYACFNIGSALRKEGKLKEAISFLKEKCKSGIATSCGLVAASLLKLNELKEVDSFFLQGCEFGDLDSCYDYASRILEEGKTAQAKTYFKKLCDDEYANGCVELAKIEASLGNKKEASRLYSVACEKKAAFGCTQMAGEVTKLYKTLKDQLRAAMPYYRKAHEILNDECSDGENASCDKLKQLVQIEAKYGISVE